MATTGYGFFQCWERYLIFLIPASFQVFDKKHLKQNILTSTTYLTKKNSQIVYITAGSSYFETLKEPPGFMKEQRVYVSEQSTWFFDNHNYRSEP